MGKDRIDKNPTIGHTNEKLLLKNNFELKGRPASRLS